MGGDFRVFSYFLRCRSLRLVIFVRPLEHHSVPLVLALEWRDATGATMTSDAVTRSLAGRVATVQAVLHDVDGDIHLAVSPDQDPAAELQRSHGRFLYFAPDEVEPIGPADAVGHHGAGQAWPAVDERPEEETEWSHG